MIVGDPASFAIESGVTIALADLSRRALGFFVIHVAGSAFGVKAPDASMLGCSLDEVTRRLDARGTHRMPDLTDIEASLIARAYLNAIYSGEPRSSYFGATPSEFIDRLHAGKIIWAPDGDAAFDDGSHILQFDIESRVRLIAFRNLNSPINTARSVREVWIEADAFYGVLEDWREAFAEDRANRPPPNA